MGLNLKNGTFFNNTRCVGSFKPIINTSENILLIPEFQLNIGEQNFDISAFINLKNKYFKLLKSIKSTKIIRSFFRLFAISSSG